LDENFALHKAEEMKMKEGLTDKHWKVIRFLRESFQKNGEVPNVFQTCEANQIELDELERLFPDGYHRGAVKIAGLHYR
jgi:tRNA 2-thiouridine synthesizing protein E